ncbi:MAG: recombinase family protein, partial [Ruminococcus sp.]|nr:recombinase family protein [Ruminococcus sp.]
LGNTIQEDFIFREVVSGETIQDRPIIKKLLDIIQNENIKGVITIEPQRLSRGDLSDCGTIIRAFRYTDTLIITPTKTYDLTDKFDRKFFEMELMKGNDYLEYIKEIMMRGRIASVNEGNFIGSVPPYGYDKIKNGKSYTLVPNSEADTLRLIFELFANENLGTTSIANYLNNLGIKPRKSPYWTNASIRDMLRNPVYIGKIRWNWRKSVKKYENGDIITSRPKSTPESWMIIDGKHEPIISNELFQKAQQRFGNTPRTKAKKEIVNQFAGIIRCECGKAMVQQSQRKGIKTRIHCPQQKICGNKSATCEDLEQVIIETLNNIINDFKSKLNDKNTDYN